MKTLFLHLGFPKTGSTALQDSLGRARQQMEEEGVLYPVVEERVHRRHNLLASPFVTSPQRMYLGKAFDGMAPEKYGLKKWHEIAAEASKYEKIIISSEHLGSIDNIEKFHRFISDKFPGFNVSTIFYLRKPSDHFASLMQQRIKGNHKISNFSPINFFDVIYRWKKYFDVELRELSKDSLKGGTIASDFSIFSGLSTSLPDIRKNEGLSSEGMQIVQDYRRAHHSNRPNRFTEDTDKLIKVLIDLESGKNNKAKLKYDISSKIDSFSFIEKLRDEFGFCFSGINYDDTSFSDDSIIDIPDESKVSDYMVVDEEKLNDLYQLVLGKVLKDSK